MKKASFQKVPGMSVGIREGMSCPSGSRPAEEGDATWLHPVGCVLPPFLAPGPGKWADVLYVSLVMIVSLFGGKGPTHKV